MYLSDENLDDFIVLYHHLKELIVEEIMPDLVEFGVLPFNGSHWIHSIEPQQNGGIYVSFIAKEGPDDIKQFCYDTEFFSGRKQRRAILAAERERREAAKAEQEVRRERANRINDLLRLLHSEVYDNDQMASDLALLVDRYGLEED